MAKIIAICKSEQKGTSKNPVDAGELKVNCGLVGDAHAGGEDRAREISLLAIESIEKMNRTGFDFHAGDFAENLTTSGIELVSLPVGTNMKVGNDVVLQVTQIGKKCHTGCAVFKQAGKCIMPKEGIFALVVTGGLVRPEDEIIVLL
ncbi:MAG: MOSC domain-containing protein [Chloroflexi bacterium]|nr:MOSC domain-containing protein [Chloroflexota bacterium]